MHISNGNRTEWSPIRSVIIRVISKSDDRAVGVRFVNHEYDYRLNRPFYSCVRSYLAMNASEAGGDLALIQTFKLSSCKCKLVCMRTTYLHNKSREVCIKTRSTPASLPVRGQVTLPTTVKWSIGRHESYYQLVSPN